MPPLITYVVAGCLIAYAVLIVVDLAASRSWRSAALQIGILVLLVVILNLTTGFPRTRTAFGGMAPVPTIGVMFVCTLLGIAARYVFYQKGKFSTRSFLKPLVITPIVLLPLIASVQAATTVEPIQLVSFAFLAFQNGFFWNVVLEQARSDV